MTNRSAVKGVNTRRLNRANEEGLVVAFDYYAPRSEAGETTQRVVAMVEAGSLFENDSGVRYFVARNIKRVNGNEEGFRTYRVDRINGRVELV